MTDIHVLAGAWKDSGWETEGLLVTPAGGDILADTGELEAGIYSFVVAWQADDISVKWVYLQHRNAANGATLKQYCFSILHAYWMVPHTIPFYQIDDNERLRMVPSGALNGTINAVIWWVRHY